MKTKPLLGFAAGLLLFAGTIQADTNYTYNMAVNQAIPDANATGFSLATNLTGLIGTITNVNVSLNISGGFNGDLYAYLVAPSGGFAVLLNRVGVTNGNSFGYSDAGFNITLDDSGSNPYIHYYQSGSYRLNGGGQLTGTWSSDGQNVDPLSVAVGSAARTATLANLAGTDPNGQWVFFVADLSGGGVSTINNVVLSIVTVPEPALWPMAAAGLAGLMVASKRVRKSSVR